MDQEPPQGLCTYTSCNKFPRLTCTRCRSAKYCSADCQGKHYKFHREACLASEKYVKEIQEKGLKLPFNRRVLVPDEGYAEMIKIIEKGEKAYLTLRTGEETEVIKRVDGRYYEKDSGDRIINMTEFEKTKKDGVSKQLTNWGRLMSTYGKVEHTFGHYSLFRDNKEKKLIIINRETDEIIEEKYIPNLRETSKCELVMQDGIIYGIDHSSS